jgi:hypothetical protein
MHGPRASYLPSPYVDDHGERHGQYRGRPLYINASRLELLRSLAANHKVRRAWLRLKYFLTLFNISNNL